MSRFLLTIILFSYIFFHGLKVCGEVILRKYPSKYKDILFYCLDNTPFNPCLFHNKIYLSLYIQIRSVVPSAIGITLLLALILSILGLTLSSRATNASISSLQDLYLRLNSLVDVTKHFRDTPYLDILLNSIVKSAIDLLKTNDIIKYFLNALPLKTLDKYND